MFCFILFIYYFFYRLIYFKVRVTHREEQQKRETKTFHPLIHPQISVAVRGGQTQSKEPGSLLKFFHMRVEAQRLRPSSATFPGALAESRMPGLELALWDTRCTIHQATEHKGRSTSDLAPC